MTSVDFNLRLSRRAEGGEASILLRVIHECKTGCVTLPYRLYPEEWDNSFKLPVIPPGRGLRGRYLKEVTAYLQKKRPEVQEIVRQLESEGPFTVHDIISRYRVKQSPGGMAALVSHLSAGLEADNRIRTARAYRTAWNRLSKFTGTTDLSGEAINTRLLASFERRLREEKKSLNTISFYMRNLRAIFNKGIKSGYFKQPDTNPFAGVYTQVAQTPKRAMNTEDMAKLENLLVTPGELKKEEKEALAQFLFAFHGCGICFVDLAHLRREDIGEYLTYYRKKTKRFIEVKVTQQMKSYLRMFPKNSSGYVFPIIRDESKAYSQYCSGLKRQNELLKRIGRIAGLSKPLTTHLARHSWATIAKKANVTIGVISECLGHNSIETTNRYLGSFGRSERDKAVRKVTKAVSGK